MVSCSMRGSDISRGPAAELPCPDVLALRPCTALLYTVMPCGRASPARSSEQLSTLDTSRPSNLLAPPQSNCCWVLYCDRSAAGCSLGLQPQKVHNPAGPWHTEF